MNIIYHNRKAENPNFQSANKITKDSYFAETKARLERERDLRTTKFVNPNSFDHVVSGTGSY